MTGRFTLKYPTTAFTSSLDKAADSAFAATKQHLVPFLVGNPSFAFERTNIDHFVSSNSIWRSFPAEALADLKTAQQLFRQPMYGPVNALAAAGHQSAQSVYFTGRDTFVSAMTDALGGATAANTAYARAHMAYATALTAYGRYNGSFTAPALTAFGAPQPTADQVTDLPDLQVLFGSLDYFQCEDCQSVVSPAAYLVDLLQYLTQFSASGAENISTARDALLARRPDLQHIALDCANTNTTLPYIDVVNEILERLVAPGENQLTLIETTGTSAERRALPQQVRQPAYMATAEQIFPLSLPFSLPFAQAEAYTKAMGTTFAAVLALFAGNPPSAAAAQFIACARLGLNPGMAQVITGDDGASQWWRWGFESQNPDSVLDPDTGQPYTPNPADWVAALSNVPLLLNRSGLTLQQLYQLLEVAWVMQSDVTLQAGTTTVAGVEVLSPDIGAMTFTGLTGDVLDRANRFLRLWNASGLPMWELDWALGPGALDDPFLVVLADALTVRDRLALPFQEVLSFWMPLETRDVTDHLGDEDTVVPATYTEIFRNPAVLATAGQVFVPLYVNAVADATDQEIIIITTPSPHGYQNGQQVSVEGVLGNTAANGTFEIAVLSATKFYLLGATGNGAWTGGGTVTGLLSGNSISGVSVVTGASDAAPIEITTATPHGYQEGQQVSVAGVLGNTAANGTFTITVTGPTSFTLNGSAGNGAWTSGGTVTGQFPTAEQTAITASLGLDAGDVAAILAFTSDAGRAFPGHAHRAAALPAPRVRAGARRGRRD